MFPNKQFFHYQEGRKFRFSHKSHLLPSPTHIFPHKKYNFLIQKLLKASPEATRILACTHSNLSSKSRQHSVPSPHCTPPIIHFLLHSCKKELFKRIKQKVSHFDTGYYELIQPRHFLDSASKPCSPLHACYLRQLKEGLCVG